MPRTIEIDFDVYKAITARRASEDITPNDVLREVLGLKPASRVPPTRSTEGGKPFVAKGVVFPDGTEFRATFKGERHHAVVQDGALVVKERRCTSVSGAASAITGNQVDGWLFWQCKRPGDSDWQNINNFRRTS
jgi:hypothetical protein